MGGNGSKSSGGGRKSNRLLVKTEKGKLRDSIRNNLKKVFESNKYTKSINNKNSIKIKLTSKTFTHIANDIIDKKVIKIHNIRNLEKQFKSSYLKKSAGLGKHRKDNIDKFYYYKAKGKRLYFNVAREKTVFKNKKVKYEYKLHSITNRLQ